MQSRWMSSREFLLLVSVREALVRIEMLTDGPHFAGEGISAGVLSELLDRLADMRSCVYDYEESLPVAPARVGEGEPKTRDTVVQHVLGSGDGDGGRDRRVRLDAPGRAAPGC